MGKSSKERGQFTILLALLLVVLIGCLGLGLDAGKVIYTKQKLQNILDLAVLAGAQEIANNPGNVVQKVKDYAELNGLNRESIQVKMNYQNDSNKIYGKISKDISLSFMPILGIKTTTVNVSATASLSTSVFGYALFSGSTSKGINSGIGNNTFDGKVHVNSSFKLTGGNNIFNDSLEVVGKIELKSDTIYNGAVINPARVIPLPQYDIYQYKSKATKIYNGNVSFSGGTLNLDGLMFVDGSISISGGCKVTGKGSIVATGDITLTGCELTLGYDGSLFALYSLKDITMTSSGKTFYGVVYAPNGTITMTGGNDTFIGSVVGLEINMSNGGYKFIYDPKATKSFGGDIGMDITLIK